jgi:protein-tyrosine phosphatase
MAQVLLERELRNRDPGVSVRSAGLRPTGRPVPEPAQRVMRARGLDLSDHQASGLDAATLEHAALVIGMEREHVRQIVADEPATWPRTFVLKELVRRAEEVGPRSGTFADWLASLHDGRRSTDLLGNSPEDDIPDPYGRDDDDYLVAAQDIEDLITRLADLAWPAPR